MPIVACGLDQADGGVYVNLSFLGAGIYGDYYLTLFQGPREQRAKLAVKSDSSASGIITYEASFMDEATIEGMDGKITKEQLSNLLISGFGGGGGGNRSVGWLKLGQFPASMTVAFGDTGDTQLTGAAERHEGNRRQEARGNEFGNGHGHRGRWRRKGPADPEPPPRLARGPGRASRSPPKPEGRAGRVRKARRSGAMKQADFDAVGFQNIVLMLIGVLVIMLVSNVLTIISNPENIKIGAVVTGAVYERGG